MAAETDTRRERNDMILAPNEFAFISDETKGDVNIFVGPNKTSLAGTDRPVVLNVKTRRYTASTLEAATQAFQTAAEGEYVVLENPTKDDTFPTGRGKLTTPLLRFGKRVVIAGPTSFALWPGQVAQTVEGHNLRSNEYLLVRVYDESAARANWSKAVIKTLPDSGESVEQATMPTKKGRSAGEAPANKSVNFDIPSEKDLTMGKLFVIRGTDVSFYIPSTGIEVVPEKVDGELRYVREAVSLERLEYCLLLDQSGTKRYVHGPSVVFPRPTEKFVEAPIKSNPEKAKAKKFRAQELTPASGIHIRVIADYTDDVTGKSHKAGEELFITGKEQTIYFPREEHATIKYGDQEMHYGIAIPVGEARYVLNRDDGKIALVSGPQIFLPDPRHEVVAQRALDLKLCELLYPGNAEALEINAARLGIEEVDFTAGGGGEAFLNAPRDMQTYGAVAAAVTGDSNRRVMIRGASKALPGDAFDRKNKFTAPRSIILNTKFDGAVTTSIWTGYAMLLCRKNGQRRVVQGPGTYMLEYDESPQVMTLSRGKPKTTDDMLRTVFLLTTANKVSDIIEVETKDFCRLNVKVSYRVNFEGDPDKWFNVDNYVKFLCDHMRSRVRAAIQKIGIEEFYSNHTDILRDIILGTSEGEKKGARSRPGTAFAENGMRIYDVEVLNVALQDPNIEKMLVNAQREVIQNTLVLASERRKLSCLKETEQLKRETEQARAETTKSTLELQSETAKLQATRDLVLLSTAAATAAERATQDAEAARQLAELNLANEQAELAQSAVKLIATNAEREAKLVNDRKTQELELEKLSAQVKAHTDKAAAIQPGLIEALQAYGDKDLTARVAEAMAPLAILGGESAVDVLTKLIGGTPLAKHLGALTKSNGVLTEGAPKTTRATRGS